MLNLLDEDMLDGELARRDLRTYVEQMWPIVEPSTEFIPNWHIDAICEHLEAVTSGEILRLILMVPPRHTKSLVVSVFWPTWAWIDHPETRWIYASYAGRLSIRDSVKCRNIINSPMYQRRWGGRYNFLEDQNLKTFFENDKTGFRMATSVGALATGEGGDVIVIDDPHKTDEAHSDTKLESVRIWHDEVWSSRVNDPVRSARVYMQHRIHGKDLCGHIMSKEGAEEYCILKLPSEYAPTTYVTALGWSDPRTEENELLNPARFPREAIEKAKVDLGSWAYASQHLQDPKPREGGVVKDAWLANRFRMRGQDPGLILQSWDCASKPKERNDPSACLTLAVFHDHIEAWDYDCKRREYPDLVRAAKDNYAEYRPNAVLIEDKDAGQQLIQTLRRDTKIPVIACDPGSLDKMTRLDAETPFIEAGNFWLPDDAEWVAPFIRELTSVPVAAHDESADTVSQALRWLRFRKKERKTALGPVSVGKESGRIT